jgi:DNA-binding IclR family transcriptional regulator
MIKSVKPVSEANFQVPALERGLEILETLRHHSEGLGINEAARLLEIPVNSAFRILNTLLQYGYVQRDAKSKKFTLSTKLFSIACDHASETTLIEAALPVMRKLRDVLKETVVISVISGQEGIVLEQVPGLHQFRFVCDPGTRQAPHASASTKAILAYLPEDERCAVLDGLPMPRFTEHTITSRQLFFQELRQVKKDGYALDQAEALEGVVCAAAPVFDRQGYPVAAITVTGPVTRMHLDQLPELGRKVQEHAHRISENLSMSKK